MQCFGLNVEILKGRQFPIAPSFNFDPEFSEGTLGECWAGQGGTGMKTALR